IPNADLCHEWIVASAIASDLSDRARLDAAARYTSRVAGNQRYLTAEQVRRFVGDLAERRGWGESEALEYVVRVGVSTLISRSVFEAKRRRDEGAAAEEGASAGQ